MGYWTYLFWAYCFVGASKTAMVLVSFPAASRAAQTMHEEAGMSGKAIFLMHAFVFLVTVCLSLFLWWVLLYREGWTFFTVYAEEDVVREVTQSIRETH